MVTAVDWSGEPCRYQCFHSRGAQILDPEEQEKT
jgi:hypothetical protein